MKIPLLLLAGCMLAVDASAGTCRIDWHPRAKGLLAVLDDGRPYKGKAYVSHDDVVRLREVLIASGECVREVEPEQCSVRRTRGGKYQIYFGGRPLYAGETHRTEMVAGKALRQLVRVGLCNSTLRPPAQSTASTAGAADTASPTQPRKLKIVVTQ